MDNIFIERLWRSLKYEEVYLKDYESVAEARAGIERYFRFYNQRTGAPESPVPDAGGDMAGTRLNRDDRTVNKERITVEVGDSVPEPLGFSAFRPEWLVLYWRHSNGRQGSAGMRPERRFERRNGRGGFDADAALNSNSDPSNISLLPAENGLDNGVHFTHYRWIHGDPRLEVLLSFDKGVIRAEGKTHAFSRVSTAAIRQFSISASTPSDSAACRVELFVFGGSIFRRYTRCRISAWVAVNRPHVRAKISPGRIPANLASFAINRSG